MGRIEQKKNIKKRNRKRIIVSILVIFLLLIGGGVAYATVLYQKFHNVANTAHTNLARGDKSDLRDVKVDPMNDNISILFIGVDKRKNEPSRSDAMILATFNHTNDSVKLVSIPRDSKVQIVDPTNQKNYGMTKITHAHYYGDLNGDKGADYTIATVEHLFNIPVDYYVQVDFKAFTKIVNALDGVEVNVPVKLVTQNSKDKKNAIVLNPGKQTLNGEQALAFVRNRKSAGAGGDFGRGKRQMALIKAILHKSANISSITKYGDVIDSLKGHFQTNLTFSQILGLHNYAGSLSNIDMMQLKGTDDMSTGTYYFQLDQNYLEQVKSELRDHLELDK
ncbi:LCP family protein [Terrilactibacillus laevilacticus]|uniref:LCP family protein n=2 Tax=Terrilactibacillus laevilacticus TaxID=1380157 RepID=A0ABW5PM85_9BACI|nr:LCP family protein [Terrilactibacillus laevilacticus]